MNGMLKMTILSTIGSTGAGPPVVGSKIITMITEGVYKVAWTEPTDLSYTLDLIAGQLEHLKKRKHLLFEDSSYIQAHFGHYLILNRTIARQEGQLKWLTETYTDLIDLFYLLSGPQLPRKIFAFNSSAVKLALSSKPLNG